MLNKRIVTITDQPRKWSQIQRHKKPGLEFYIASQPNERQLAASQKHTDLLIISQEDSQANKLDVQSLSSHLGATYTLIVPPQNVDHFVSTDFTKITASLFNSFSSTNTDSDIFAIEQCLEFSGVADHSPAIHMNGYLLGPFHVLINGLLLNDFAGRKSKSLLAYLLCNNRRPNFRETLMEKFWPDVHPESARNSLNVAIHGIRGVFRKLIPKHDLLVYKHDKYFLNPNIEIKLDHEDFLYKINTGKRIEARDGIHAAIRDFEEAVRLYKGDFLEDSPHEEWSFIERERIKEGYFHALDRLSNHYCASGKYKIAQHYCRKLLNRDTCREDIHRRMMLCLFRTGHRDLAVKQFHRCEKALLHELDMSPSQATLELLNDIKKG